MSSWGWDPTMQGVNTRARSTVGRDQINTEIDWKVQVNPGIGSGCAASLQVNRLYRFVESHVINVNLLDIMKTCSRTSQSIPHGSLREFAYDFSETSLWYSGWGPLGKTGPPP